MLIALIVTKLIMLLFVARHSVHSTPIKSPSLLNNGRHRSLAKRALSYLANETVCIIDNLIYQNGDPIPTDDPCESCKCRPPGFACVLRECEVKVGCKEIPVEGDCCPTYQCGCEHDGRMYKDGEVVPNPNKLLKCYRCRCRGSSIICGLMDCQLRFDCPSRYEEGECCPTYDHCDTQPPTSTTLQSTFNNQTVATSSIIGNTSDISTGAFFSTTRPPTTLRVSSQLLDLFSPDSTRQPAENSTPIPSLSTVFSSPANSEQFSEQPQATTVATTQYPSAAVPSSDQSTISPNQVSLDSNKIILDSQPENEPNSVSNELSKISGSLSDRPITKPGSNRNEINQLAKNEINDLKASNQAPNQTASSTIETVEDEEIVSDISSNRITPSIASVNEVAPLNSNQVNQLERRVDGVSEPKNEPVKEDERVNEDRKDEILGESLIAATTLPSQVGANSLFQPLTTSQSLLDSVDAVPSSTSVPNITDTTILAPSSTANFITQSPIINEPREEAKGALDSEELAKNETSDELKKDESIDSDIKDDRLSEEENLVKKLEEKLEGKPESKPQEKPEEKPDLSISEQMKTPLSLLSKVLDNCSNGRCNTMEKLVKVTETVLSELDPKIVEKVKLSDAFEQLRVNLVVNASLSTDIPIVSNSTEFGIVELEESAYPTTVRYLRTSELNAEHKDSDVDDLELEEDLNKTYRFF